MVRKTTLNTNMASGFLARLLLLAFALTSSGAVIAIAAGTPPVDAKSMSNDLSAQIELELMKDSITTIGKTEIHIGEPDARLNLAPCNKMIPFLPPGTRAWGRFNIGVRCVEGARWTIFVPAQVKIIGSALVARQALAIGSPVMDAEVEEQEIELTREPSMPITDRSQLKGKLLSRAIFPGQIIRPEFLRFPPAINQGDMVKVVASGEGFQVTADGEALSHANLGQSVRVKTESGRTISGIAKAGKTVEIRISQ
jgi:flagella basal body P-ring formation protein FlgA